MKNDGEYNICVILPEIENLLEININKEPYECNLSKSKYFLENNICVKISENDKIKNFLFYNSEKNVCFVKKVI